MNENREVPRGLSLMLRDFTVAVLRKKPDDLYKFAAEYFCEKIEEKNNFNNNNVQINKKKENSDRTISKTLTNTNFSEDCGMYIIVTDNNEQVEDPIPAKLQNFNKDLSSEDLLNTYFKLEEINNQNLDKPASSCYLTTHKFGSEKMGRRRSVAAERYDPEIDDDVTVHEILNIPKSDEQRKRLKEAVAGILIFRSLEPDQMNNVIDAMFEKRVQSGDHIIMQGDDGDNFYVIDCGVYDVIVTISDQKVCVSNKEQILTNSIGFENSTNTHTNSKKDVKSLHKTPDYILPETDKRILGTPLTEDQRFIHRFVDSGSFGELALLYNQPRSASVVALLPGSLWAMSRGAFRRIVLRSACQKRRVYEKLITTVPALEHLDAYERANLADALISVKFEGGQRVISEGDEADGMYFVESGEVRVTVTKNGMELEAARIGPGGYFGEMALVEKVPRSANVYVCDEQSVKLAFLEIECFERLLGSCLDIMKRNISSYVKSTI